LWPFWPTLELFLTDFPQSLVKEEDPSTGLFVFHPKAEIFKKKRIEKTMAEVRVITRAVAHKGKEDQLKVLLQGMLGPRRPNRDVSCMNFTSQARGADSIFTNCGKVRLRLGNTQRALTISTCNEASEIYWKNPSR
jgi:hypothetical protein